jgi:hypothetical protein
MLDIMNAEDRLEVREMLLDILSGPLEKINGQYRLVSNQLSNIEIQTTKTNGNVTEIDVRLKSVEIKVAKEIPHTIVGCPQAEIIEELKSEVLVIKNSQVTETKVKDVLRNNANLILIAIGLIVTLIVGLVNLNKNNTQTAVQQELKKELKIIMQDDSTLTKGVK